jgi:serine/threonine-protein kinase
MDDTASAETLADEGEAGSQPSLPGYELGTLIGQGGMGEVVVARDPKIGREVAIKRMKAKAPPPEAVERFLREAKIQARLDHPAIVPVHELGHDSEGRPYFTMKRLAGTTMAEVMKKADAQQRLVRAFVDVCLAIELAHTRHVVHRDLKPSNIMLGDYGEVYVIDWGVARIVGEAEAGANADITTLEGHTQAGALLGTPGYMAPEQAKGEPIGPAADVYALGCILFEILVGKPLHAPGMAAIGQTIANPTASPASRAPDRTIPPELDAACVAALAEDPAARPSARALGERVQRYLDGDRDLERRRELAAEFLAQAKAATRHADQMRLAGRALALDPESQEAAALVTRLMLEPPDEIPPDLEHRIGAGELEYERRSAAIAMGALAAYFVFLPILFWMGVTNVPLLVGAYALIVVLFVMTYFQARKITERRRFNLYPTLIGNVLVAAVISRVCGPFMLVPQSVTIIAVGMMAQPQLLRRTGIGLAICTLGFLGPIVLEALGVLGSTWHAEDGQFVFRSTLVHIGGLAGDVMLISGTLGGIIIAGLFSRGLASARRDAIQRLELQSWRLMQLVPESIRR